MIEVRVELDGAFMYAARRRPDHRPPTGSTAYALSANVSCTPA